MTEAHWELYSHPSDIGVRGVGPTREEAFAQAALALTSVITELGKVQAEEAVDIECKEDDEELLFLCWLSALLYEMDTRGMLFSRFEVEAVAGGIKARAWGEPVDVARHEPAVEVKAATYADLKVARGGDGVWLAQCIVDV
ncbi:MAG: archease [Planctomycetes bacterium]|jgi:tRNA nucleotidyltransferase (CCA-adding enzyme)|nr:archease [Planctomycetota bacterium]